MKLFAYIFALLGCISLGAIGSPILRDDSRHAKRALEVVNGKEIVNTQTGAKEDISVSDQKTIERTTEKMRTREIPNTSAIHAFYDYYPLGKGKDPIPAAGVKFWPPENEDGQQQKILKEKLDAAKTKWKETDEYQKVKESLDELAQRVTVSKILGLGCGSLNGLNAWGEDVQNWFQERAYIQTAIVLTIQEELKNGAKVILQDPGYGKTETDFLTESASSGSVQVMLDPDGFEAIDEETIVFTIGGFDGFWYRIAQGPTPVAIISSYLDTPVGDGAMYKPPKDEWMLKPQLDLLEEYTGVEVAAAGVHGWSADRKTSFWTRICD